MKMLVLIFRSSFADEVLKTLDGLKLSGYTEAPAVFGTGAEGRVFESHAWPGHNTMILSALGANDVSRVVGALEKYSKARHKEGEQVPIRIFAVPCEQLF
ncbi:MAG: hypothetical protein E6Q99_00165 [Elusimicrobia bacterium]|jgi:hypothetical protein|nr:MAG: hypothetical protein E6Q99_00165 [Elusimicrobiota bacterium]HMU74793.1 hypothetical protein [Elusimicrobiota bacterium]